MTVAIHVFTALGVAVLIALEMSRPEFRADSFGAGPKRTRNWLFLAAGLVPIVAVQTLGPWLRALLPPLVEPGLLGPAVDVVGCLVVAELVSWVSHWVKHRSRELWCFHFQHHRDSHFSLWMVAHTHAVEVALSGLAMVALLAWVGFTPVAVQVYFALYTVTLLYHHSGRDYSLGPLDWLVVSPAFHRHHHQVGGRGNYGAVLTLFDVLFRTAHWPEEDDSQAPLGLGPRAREPFGFVAEMTWFFSRGRNPRA